MVTGAPSGQEFPAVAFAPSGVLDNQVCSCGHSVRRHWNDGGCGEYVRHGTSVGRSHYDRLPCACSLTRVECQFHVVRASLPTSEKIYVRHSQHLRRFLVTPQFIPHDVRWTVRPWVESSIVVVFTTWRDAIEFATRDWINPLGIESAT